MSLCFLLALQMAAVPPMPPQSQAETATMKAAQSLAESTTAAPKDLRTHAEQSNYQETGSYDEAVSFYRKLEKLSPLAKLVPLGQTGEGRTLYALIVSKEKAFTPEAARRTGKPVVLLQNGIHAGENGGKDAAMMLLRDVLVTKRHAAWLDHSILVSIVVFNADGHEHVSGYNRINENGPAKMGFRVNASRLNLNRDYLKAQTPEMRAWLKLYTAWLPDFLVDNHVTDGSDNQYDVTIATHTEQDIAPEVGEWVEKKYLTKLIPEMEKLGHVVGWYIEGRGRNGDSLAVMTASPRYSTGYAAAQNRAGLLVETHSLKSFKTRVWSHYDIMAVSLDAICTEAKALRSASLAADQRYEALKPGAKVFLEGTPGDKQEPYVQRLLAFERPVSTVSGGPVVRYSAKPVDQQAQLVRSLTEKVAPVAPDGYIVPRQWNEVIELLHIHGIKTQTINKKLNQTLDVTKVENVRWATAPFEGRFQVQSFTSRTANQAVEIPAGSVYVPAAQRAGKVAMHILEPAAPDSAVRWGFFQSVFEQKEYFSDYVFEPYAVEMLKQNPALKAEFDAKVQSDATFAKNPRARLLWLFQRSPYFEPDKDTYPVLRVTPAEMPAVKSALGTN
ncbi:M14 family metallopeptidase [Paludibaculum fermentans]|uniref:Peptidase M14 n=1 Tax=Paludibaculum fermentans TaxID=1473598 RepID=A0A7S7NVA8_PALFE|nr:M14 family metallopeptidase [Paludibaculum fermentans]QOY90424.1 peptidase M14 [Paludibaculum fermentans]